MRMIKALLRRLLLYKPKEDSLISFLAYLLIIEGCIFSLSASQSYNTTFKSMTTNIVKQLIFASLAIFAYQAMMRVFVLSWCKRFIKLLALLQIIVLGFTFVYCYFTGAINGNYSWITLPFGASIQPSEFAKIIIILLVATQFSDKSFRAIKSYWGIIKLPLVLSMGIYIIILLLQRDTGSFVICFCLGCACYLVPNNKRLKASQILLAIGGVLCVVGLVLLFVTPAGQQFLMSKDGTIFNRFKAVFNPSYTDDGTREIFYSLLGISKGSFFGVGLGNSVQKFGYLVSSEADYVFAVIVEETGLLGVIAVFVPYFLLIKHLLNYVSKMKTECSQTILIGTVVYLFLHFLFNVGGVSGLIPLTGVPLLFLSKGGSALLSIMTMLGICQAEISAYHYELEKEKKLFDI